MALECKDRAKLHGNGQRRHHIAACKKGRRRRFDGPLRHANFGGPGDWFGPDKECLSSDAGFSACQSLYRSPRTGNWGGTDTCAMSGA